MGQPWPHVILADPYTAGLAVARRMVRLGARVTVIETQRFVGRSRRVESVVTDFAPAGEPWLEALLAAAPTEPAVVLTGTDRGSEWLVGAASRLPANVRAFEHPGSAHLSLMNKARADRIARDAGVSVPWTAFVASSAEFSQVAADAPWPCVVKPALSHEWRSRYGEVRAFLVSSPEEADRVMHQPLADRVRMLLSQYIPGGDDHVEEAILVRLADGSYPVQFGCRKLRQYPPGFGETALGESSLLPETTMLARRVLDRAGFVGVAGVEAKRHAQTGERWFLEVNVRLPAQWGLGDACGAEATPRLVSSLLGRSVGTRPAMRPGVRFVQPDLDRRLIVPAVMAAPARTRPRSVWRVARSYAGARELGVFDPRDLGPARALARLFLHRRLARLAARVRSRQRRWRL